MSEKDKPVAIITGSASGIGAAISERLAEKGWNIVINYTRSKTEAEKTALRCEANGVQTSIYKGSVDSDDHCLGMVSLAENRWGRVDALVNNAGTTKKIQPEDLAGLCPEDFEKIFSVNVTGAYMMARAASSLLKKSNIGSIVNLSSYSAFSGIGSSIAYASSKGALNTLTKSLAIALSPEIRVNAICPGYVDTRWVKGSMSKSDYKEFKERIIRKSLLMEMVDANDVADLAEFLILGAKKITGETIIIDSGFHLCGSVPLGTTKEM